MTTIWKHSTQEALIEETGVTISWHLQAVYLPANKGPSFGRAIQKKRSMDRHLLELFGGTKRLILVSHYRRLGLMGPGLNTGLDKPLAAGSSVKASKCRLCLWSSKARPCQASFSQANQTQCRYSSSGISFSCHWLVLMVIYRIHITVFHSHLASMPHCHFPEASLPGLPFCNSQVPLHFSWNRGPKLFHDEWLHVSFRTGHCIPTIPWRVAITYELGFRIFSELGPNKNHIGTPWGQ